MNRAGPAGLIHVEPLPDLSLIIRGPLAPGDLPGLCDRVCAAFEAARPRTVVVACPGIGADAVVVDALGRLTLVAQRYGADLELREVSADLTDLIRFLGLDRLLRPGDAGAPSR